MATTPTQGTQTQSNTLLYTLIGVVLILLGYITYVYLVNDIVKKGTLKKDYILKSNLSFDMLPSYEKGKYVDFYKYDQDISQLNEEIQNLKANNSQNREPQVVEKVVEVEKIIEVPVEKIVEVKKVVQVPVKIDNIDTTKYETYTCKGLEEGSVKITALCKKELYQFLDKNKDAKKYEVIGMVDDIDFKFVNKLKDVYGEKRVKHLSKYSQIGLSRQRVIEASWLIKKHIGDYQIIDTVNYTVHTKDKKGFVVRAYK